MLASDHGRPFASVYGLDHGASCRDFARRHAGYYDAQRNELYFLAGGWHPDFGYVDQPPLVPLIAAATQVFGISTWMLRLPATIAAVGLVFLAASFARLLGGGTRAAAFATIAAAVAPGITALTRI